VTFGVLFGGKWENTCMYVYVYLGKNSKIFFSTKQLFFYIRKMYALKNNMLFVFLHDVTFSECFLKQKGNLTSSFDEFNKFASGDCNLVVTMIKS